MQIDNTIAAVVTGGASGLGEATARALAAKGAKVALFDLNEERGEAVAAEIGGVFCKVDVSSEESIAAGFAKAREAHGQERVLVNCAGIGTIGKLTRRDRETGEISHLPFDLFEKTIKVNLMGTFGCMAKAATGMMTLDPVNEHGERGVMISTASVAAEDGQIGQAAYSASKAGSDHLAKAYYRTYGFPTVITNCSNNYGPYQFPEKLIPLMILNIQEEKPLPVYGDGKNVRDWLFVLDHCDALLTVLTEGQNGETYNIGGGEEMQNIDVVNLLCNLLDAKLGRQGEKSSSRLIHFVKDRPGHDRRYAIDSTKIRSELGWTPQHDFKTALAKTVDWYLDNQNWVESIRTGEYLKWIDQNYEGRRRL